ncbi:right-handed parallel beta-helix repeat-containing protein [Marinobacter sp. F4216]|uniref:right-handed parallel beta-helix repeat-containing protein n=1 Tax=Marinobacter sp. F4216 TaxID=2874281 RepID=UPI001CBF00CC|nr:right-handed parallel beta-helix repeat-containing protein [Marinobacter sp. F4216]MBZ2167502.1 right-handed parallel beta-helix repeat-containing protein [Marinobacter sp. F4216]
MALSPDQPEGVSPIQETGIPENANMTLGRYERVNIPDGHAVIHVSDSKGLKNAFRQVADNGGHGAIILEDGQYRLETTVYINHPNVMLLSKSNDPEKVIIRGSGMQPGNRVKNLLHIKSSGFVLEGITLQQAGNHLVQLAAEKNADVPTFRNCIIEDGYEQLLKVSFDKKNHPRTLSDNGLVEYCVFRYTAGIGPNYYIGGIDAHGIRGWVIRHNVFQNIASPADRIAEHAVHIWNNTSNNTVESNVFIDNDRAIGFGMRMNNRHPNIIYSNFGGKIVNNLIYHDDRGNPFSDTGIILEDSPYTLIKDNWIYLEHRYPRAIEYRFPETRQVRVTGNQTNKRIASRNGGHGELARNTESLERNAFMLELEDRLESLNLPGF